MSTITWKKKNGNEIETNDLPATVAYMEEIGAKEVSRKKDKKEKKTKEGSSE